MTDRGAAPARARPRRPACLLTCLLALPLVCVLMYLGLRGLGAFLITGDPLERGDAVVVLGGGGEHRVAEAVRLVKERYGMWLIVTEPGEMASGEGPGSEIFRRVAILEGVSPDVILITEKTAQSTYQEAEAVLHTMEKHQLHSIVVVTDPFHTQRTRMIFASVFAGSGRTVRIHPVPEHWYRSSTWFLSLEGWSHTAREYVKMAGFLLGITSTLE
jgi:uncharacterized SAM-binding protein YcdF (DUF218 family)